MSQGIAKLFRYKEISAQTSGEWEFKEGDTKKRFQLVLETEICQ